MAIIERLDGKGLAWVNGDAHKRQRALTAPFLTHQRIRMADDILQTLVLRFVERFNDSLEPNGTSKVNMVSWLSRITLDVVGAFCFGHDFGCGENPESEVIRKEFEGQTRIGMTFAGFAAPLVLRSLPWLANGVFKFTAAQDAAHIAIKRTVREALLHRSNGDLSEEKVDLLDGLMKTMNMNDEAEVDEMLDQASGIRSRHPPSHLA